MDRQTQSRRHRVECVDLDAERLERLVSRVRTVSAVVNPALFHAICRAWGFRTRSALSCVCINPWRASGNAPKPGGPTAPLPSRADCILCSSQLSRTNPTEVEWFGGPV
jgi:hypothetical protein